MSNVIEHINTDENKEQISLQELQGALKNGFFDKKENVDAIGKELNVIDANLKNTLVEGYKQYLNSLTTEQLKALSKNQGSVGEKKLFQLASMATLGITTIDNKPISVDGIIGKQGRTLLNLLYVGATDIYQGAKKKQELVNVMSQLTIKLDANNLTLFNVIPGNKEYITALFAKDPVLLSQAIQSCPDMKIFSTNYPFSNYLAEYIATGGQLTSETKLILDQGSKSIKQKEQQQAQQQQFEKRKLQLDTIPGEIKKLEGSLVTTSQELQTQKDAYNIVYKEFCELLKQNNTRYEKAKNIAPLALVVALPGIGRALTGKARSALNTDEQKQLDSYTKLKKSYDTIVTTEKKITSYKTQIESKQQEMQYGYYELVKEFGNQKDADQALVNLVAQYGTQVQKKYSQAISEATTRVSEPQRLVLQANKTQLDVYMKRKETTIDIAQQVLGGGPVRFQSCSQEDIAHLGLGQVKNLLSAEEQNQAIMNAGTIAVRDNTAVARHRQTTENVMENGNIVGQKTQYHYTDGKTSTAGYEIENQYRLASEKFKYLTIPGMGTILAKIEPAFYNQLQSVKLEKNQKLIFQPRYNKEFSCFDIDASCVIIGWKDSKGTIGYKSLGQEKISYIQNSEYQSLLQVKEGYGTLLKQDEKIKQVSDYMADLQQTAGSIQQLANVYAQTPGDEILSQTIMDDITKTGGLKSQIEGLKRLLSTNGKYQSVIDMIITNKSGVYDRHEHELHGLQEQLTSLTKYTEQLDKLLAYSVREGAESRQVKEFMIQVVAIAAGVLAAVATGGAGGFLVTTAISTAAGMAGARLTQEAFARGTDTRGMTNDLHSDIGKCMNGQAKRSEVLPKVGMEFAQGFATTTMFIGAGRVIGTQLEKFVLANAGTASREVKLAHKVRKSISKLNDSEIQLLEQRGFSQFVKKFGKEFTQEMGEEGVQQGADKIDSRLGGLVSMMSCISGKRSYHAGKTEVFIEGFDNQTHTTTVSYIGDVHTIQTDLAKTATSAGYTLASSENGMVTYIKITDGVTESLVFKPIQESISMKSLDLGEHAKIYGIQHNKTENGEYHYNYSKLQDGNNDLTVYLARNGMVIQGSIHEDGSFTTIDQNGEKIHFAKTNEVKPKQVQEKKPQGESGDNGNEDEKNLGYDGKGDNLKNKPDETHKDNNLFPTENGSDNDLINNGAIIEEKKTILKDIIINFNESYDKSNNYKLNALLELSVEELLELKIKVNLLIEVGFKGFEMDEVYQIKRCTFEGIDTFEQKLKLYKVLGISLFEVEHDVLHAFINLEVSEIDYLITIKSSLNKLGIIINAYNIKNLTKISQDQIKIATGLKPRLDQLGIGIGNSPYVIQNLSTLFTLENFQKILSVKEKYLDNIGLRISIFDIQPLLKIEKHTREKLVSIKSSLDDLGIKITIKNMKKLSKLTIEEIQKVRKLKPELDKLGIKIDASSIKSLSELTIEELQKLQELKPHLDSLGVEITSYNIKTLSELTVEEIQKVQTLKPELDKLGIKIEFSNIKATILLFSQNSIQDIRNYINNRNKYLNKNRALSDNDFTSLFMKEVRNEKKLSFIEQFKVFIYGLFGVDIVQSPEFEKGKFGKSELSQGNIGNCVFIAQNARFRFSNYFETIIKTSIKVISENERKVRIPLGSKEGKWISVLRNELEGHAIEGGFIKGVNASDGFKILEIARAKSKKDDGSFDLRNIEGGLNNNFKDYLGIPMEKLSLITDSEHFDDKLKLGLSKVKSGTTYIGLSSGDTNHIANGSDRIIPGYAYVVSGVLDPISGEPYIFYTNHEYSLERTYEKNGKEYFIIVNPRDSSKKIEMDYDQLKSGFTLFDIHTIDIQKLFQ